MLGVIIEFAQSGTTAGTSKTQVMDTTAILNYNVNFNQWSKVWSI